jgi:hypothetical protein
MSQDHHRLRFQEEQAVEAPSQLRLQIHSGRATFVACPLSAFSPTHAADQGKLSVTPKSFPFRQTGSGVTVIGGMNFLVVAPQPKEPDGCNGCAEANVQ